MKKYSFSTKNVSFFSGIASISYKLPKTKIFSCKIRFFDKKFKKNTPLNQNLRSAPTPPLINLKKNKMDTEGKLQGWTEISILGFFVYRFSLSKKVSISPFSVSIWFNPTPPPRTRPFFHCMRVVSMVPSYRQALHNQRKLGQLSAPMEWNQLKERYEAVFLNVCRRNEHLECSEAQTVA